jgi:histidinol-phosphate phosphatase family protein
MGCDLMLAPFRDNAELTTKLELSNLPNEISWDGKIAFLDRDGVINLGSNNYVNNQDEIKILPNAGSCIGDLRRAGFRICIVTNQSPIGRGLWSHENLCKIHNHIRKLLLEEDSDAILDLILYSPYAPWQGAWARKPNPGMLEAGRQILDHAHIGNDKKINILYDHEWKNRPEETSSIMVGDRNVDLLASQCYGVKFYKCDPYLGISEVISSILGVNNG